MLFVIFKIFIVICLSEVGIYNENPKNSKLHPQKQEIENLLWYELVEKPLRVGTVSHWINWLIFHVINCLKSSYCTQQGIPNKVSNKSLGYKKLKGWFLFVPLFEWTPSKKDVACPNLNTYRISMNSFSGNYYSLNIGHLLLKLTDL